MKNYAKLSRPQHGENWEDFLREEGEKYRPQLLAYGEMVAAAKGISLDAHAFQAQHPKIHTEKI